MPPPRPLPLPRAQTPLPPRVNTPATDRHACHRPHMHAAAAPRTAAEQLKMAASRAEDDWSSRQRRRSWVFAGSAVMEDHKSRISKVRGPNAIERSGVGWPDRPPETPRRRERPLPCLMIKSVPVACRWKRRAIWALPTWWQRRRSSRSSSHANGHPKMAILRTRRRRGHCRRHGHARASSAQLDGACQPRRDDACGHGLYCPGRSATARPPSSLTHTTRESGDSG